jgi:transcriptional regulator with XRE-family HTH domain
MTLREQLRVNLKDNEYRHAYSDEHLNLSISTQIKVLREQQNLTQAQLAEKIGTKQAGVSRLESANYTSWSIAALRKVAQALDLRLRVSFEEFGSLWREVADFSRESLQRRTFAEDPEFQQPVEERHKIRRKRAAFNGRRRSIHPKKRRSPPMPPWPTSSEQEICVGAATAGSTNAETISLLPWINNSSTPLPGGLYDQRI